MLKSSILMVSKTMVALWVVSLALLATSAMPSVSDANTAIPISEARTRPLGTTVTVEGSVTVPSGTLASAGPEDLGFAMQDSTAGIYVSVNTDLHLNLHRKVRVTGVLADLFGLLSIVPVDLADVDILPGAQRIKPESVNTSDISAATEGLLVTITGTITEPLFNDLPFGYVFVLDDGSGEAKVYIYASSGIDPFNIPFLEPGEAVRITGFVGQFDTLPHEVTPRKRGDIHRAHDD
jgi:hypothetical protein